MTRNVVKVVAVAAVAAAGLVQVAPSGGAREAQALVVALVDSDRQPVRSRVAVFDSEGRLVAKLAPDAAGRVELSALPGQKLELVTDWSAATVDRGQPAAGGLVVPRAGLRESAINVVLRPPARALAPPTPPVLELQGDDTCEGIAEAPVAVPSVTAGDTTAATIDAAYPECDLTITAPGVWFSVEGTGNTMTASTCERNSAGSADYDSKITVFCRGCDPLEVKCIGGNDDFPGCNFHSSVSWPSQAGREYQILVHGFGGNTGSFELAVFDDGVPATAELVDCAPPPVRGACCFNHLMFPFDCRQLTAEECATEVGEYSGDDSPCLTVGVPDEALTTDPPGEIPPGSGVPVVSEITIFPTDPCAATQAGFPVGAVEVDVRISHTYIGDLSIDLVHAGRRENLWDGRCGDRDDMAVTFASEGNSRSCADVAAGGFRFSPADTGSGDLDNFIGADAAGPWTLEVSDPVPFDEGTLESWSLRLFPAQPACSATSAPVSESALHVDTSRLR